MMPENGSEPSACGAGDAYGHALADLIDRDLMDRLVKTVSRLSDGTIRICDQAGNQAGNRVGQTAGEEPSPAVTCDRSDEFRVPIQCDGHTLGCVVAREEEPTERVRHLAGHLADVMSAICQKEVQIRRRVSELTAVYDLGGLFAGTTDLGQIVNVAAKRICDVLGVKAVIVRLLDEETEQLVVCGAYNLSREYLDKGPVTVRNAALEGPALAGEIVYVQDARTDPRMLYPEHARREGLVSALICPLSYRGRTVGVLRAYTGQRRKFSSFEVELLREVASQAAGAIVNSRLIEEQIAMERQRLQVEHAGQIQRQMIPDEPPEHSRITFGQVYEPCLQVGGDFFDFLMLPDGNIGLVIADVVGKGIPAALMMASVRSALRAHARSIYDINEIVSLVNRHLCRDTLASQFATLFYGVFSSDADRFTYCNAGHNPVLLLRGDVFVQLESGGSVIGVDPDEVFDKQAVELESGDLLVFYTDGVTEAINYDGVLYGITRLRESIVRYRDLEPPTFANQLLWDVRRFAGLVKQSDDIALVVARIA